MGKEGLTAAELIAKAQEWEQKISAHHPQAGEFARATAMLYSAAVGIQEAELDRTHQQRMGYLVRCCIGDLGELLKQEQTRDPASAPARGAAVLQAATTLASELGQAIGKGAGAPSAAAEKKGQGPLNLQGKDSWEALRKEKGRRPTFTECAESGHPGHMAEHCENHGWCEPGTVPAKDRGLALGATGLALAVPQDGAPADEIPPDFNPLGDLRRNTVNYASKLAHDALTAPSAGPHGDFSQLDTAGQAVEREEAPEVAPAGQDEKEVQDESELGQALPETLDAPKQ